MKPSNERTSAFSIIMMIASATLIAYVVISIAWNFLHPATYYQCRPIRLDYKEPLPHAPPLPDAPPNARVIMQCAKPNRTIVVPLTLDENRLERLMEKLAHDSHQLYTCRNNAILLGDYLWECTATQTKTSP